jgi:hypothetical protein
MDEVVVILLLKNALQFYYVIVFSLDDTLSDADLGCTIKPSLVCSLFFCLAVYVNRSIDTINSRAIDFIHREGSHEHD